MKKKQATKILKTIEDFFQKVRYNIVLHSILESKEHDAFKAELRESIEKQILYFAKVEKVNNVIGVTKLGDLEMLERVRNLFPPLSKFLDVETIESYLLSVAKNSGNALIRQVKGEETYELGARIKKIIEHQAAQSIDQIDNTTQQYITKVIERGLNDGDNHYVIAKTLRSDALKIAEYRSEMIAEQEAALLIGDLTLDIFRSHDIQYKRLITSRDEAVCTPCDGDAQAGVLGIDEMFPSGAIATPVHIGCRCFIEPIELTN